MRGDKGMRQLLDEDYTDGIKVTIVAEDDDYEIETIANEKKASKKSK
jgi:hypothetical protein